MEAKPRLELPCLLPWLPCLFDVMSKSPGQERVGNA
jgi:hypothetical protein